MPTLPVDRPTRPKQVRVKPKRFQRRCAGCRAIFVWRRSDKIYCSTQCRVRAWLTKRRKEASNQPSKIASERPPDSLLPN